MCCVRDCSVASATRLHAGNCTAGCRSVWCGARPTERCCCIRTSRCAPRSALCSNALPRWARHDACGCGSARRACASRCTRPRLPDLRWVAPTYTKIHQVLTNPFYAGVYVYGRTQQTRYIDESWSRAQSASQPRPRAEWPVFIRDHHLASSTGSTFEANQKAPRAEHPSAAAPERRCRERRRGAAARHRHCGHCGRRLAVHYSGRYSAPGYHCAGKNIVNGRGEYCLNVGGVPDRCGGRRSVPRGARARRAGSLAARPIEQLEADHETTLEQFRRDVERARYDAQRAERRYRAVDPDNRLVARGLEAEWESVCSELKTAEAELAQIANTRDRVVLTRESTTRSSRSVKISTQSGLRRRRPTAIARSCCARCSRMS